MDVCGIADVPSLEPPPTLPDRHPSSSDPPLAPVAQIPDFVRWPPLPSDNGIEFPGPTPAARYRIDSHRETTVVVDGAGKQIIQPAYKEADSCKFEPSPTVHNYIS